MHSGRAVFQKIYKIDFHCLLEERQSHTVKIKTGKAKGKKFLNEEEFSYCFWNADFFLWKAQV